MSSAQDLWVGASVLALLLLGRWWIWGAIWRGDFYRELGKLGKAEDWYLSAWQHPVAHERLGRLYEKRGRPEKAKAVCRRFTQAWKNTDPALQGRVETARERLEVLTDSRSNVTATTAE